MEKGTILITVQNLSLHLMTGDQPSTEPIEGPYPTVITQASGRKVLVVQAYAWGKYMGFINVTFDENFEVQSWDGDPILLDNTIQRGKRFLLGNATE